VNASVPLTEFQQLLDRLEGSKKRQQRQKSVEGRRDIYSQGHGFDDEQLLIQLLLPKEKSWLILDK
jgi:hypothetical protein